MITSISYNESLKLKRHFTNRPLDKRHIKRLKNGMSKAYEIFPPITVNKSTNTVIDGHHRLKAYQELMEENKLPITTELEVKYVDILKDEEEEAIKNANRNSKKWSVEDYIQSYKKAGNTAYIKFDEWCMRHILTRNNKNKPMRNYATSIILRTANYDFTIGKLDISDEQYEFADVYHEELVQIGKALHLKIPAIWVKFLAPKWIEKRNKHPFDMWIKEFKKATYRNMPHETSKDFDKIICRVDSNLPIEQSQRAEQQELAFAAAASI